MREATSASPPGERQEQVAHFRHFQQPSQFVGTRAGRCFWAELSCHLAPLYCSVGPVCAAVSGDALAEGEGIDAQILQALLQPVGLVQLREQQQQVAEAVAPVGGVPVGVVDLGLYGRSPPAQTPAVSTFSRAKRALLVVWPSARRKLYTPGRVVVQFAV